MQRVLAMFYERIILTLPRTPKVLSAYRSLVLLACTLVAVFSLTILLARVLRRYRQTYMRSRRKPTPNADVWRQHRLPDGWEKTVEPGEPPKDG
jgi:hypothetical protein